MSRTDGARSSHFLRASLTDTSGVLKEIEMIHTLWTSLGLMSIAILPFKQKHFSFRILSVSSKKKTRFLNKEARSLQKSVFMMSKTKEEKKKFIYVHKLHTAPIHSLHSCFWGFIVKKKEPMHLMKRTKKKNTQHLVKNIMPAVQNFLLSKHLHIASQSYS